MSLDVYRAIATMGRDTIEAEYFSFDTEFYSEKIIEKYMWGIVMVKIHCDRCGAEIEGTTYYTISIYADDINPKPTETVTYATAIQNVATNTLAIFNARPQYCKKCKDEIENFIKIT